MEELLASTIGPTVEISYDLDEDVPVPVLADVTQLELAILNLAINARDAMPEGGRISISTQRCQIEDDPELEPSEYVQVCVSDTGSGMSPEVASRAFDPFFTTKGPGKGTGLGLSMVYGVAKQSGGTARILRPQAGGTSIALFLRRVLTDPDQEAARSDGSSEIQPRAKRGKLLVVDDDVGVRGFVSQVLSDHGHEVVEASSGLDALGHLEDQQFDLLVLDFAMPGMSGADLAAEVLRSNPGQSLLFITGFSESSAIEAAAPQAVVLRKPFRPDDLISAVDGAIRFRKRR